MHKKKLFFFLLIFLNLTFINKLFAIDPYSFVQETADRASEALNKRQSKEEKMEKLIKIINELYNFTRLICVKIPNNFDLNCLNDDFWPYKLHSWPSEIHKFKRYISICHILGQN